jgi:subtilisin family serine protease
MRKAAAVEALVRHHKLLPSPFPEEDAMKPNAAVFGILGLVLLLPHEMTASPALVPAGASAREPFVPGEVLVKFRPSVLSQGRYATVSAHGHSIVTDQLHPNWAHVRLPVGQSVTEAIAAYRSDSSVEYVQPNYIYRIAVAPNDPQYGQLWAFKNAGQTITNGLTQPPSSPLGYATNNPGTASDDMHIEKAWDHITDCSSVAVALVDSGVNYNQEDLSSNMWNGGATFPKHGYNYVDNTTDPMDLNGHGTHVAGIIGAVGNNAKGTTGVCWKASIMAVRVMDAIGRGTTANIIQGINFAVAHSAKVINMSLGGGGSFDQLFSDSITNAQNADVVVVVAAGNDGKDNDSGTAPAYPCNFPQPNLICVAALDQGFQLATFSNYGSISVDVGAPGTNILSTWAGTVGVTTDGLTAGWTGSTTTTGGWAYATFGSASTPFLIDPSNYPSGLYNKNTDDRVYKAFNVSGVDVALLRFEAAVNVVSGDHFRIGYASTAADPFGGGGVVVGDATNIATYPNLVFSAYDISACNSTSCTIGFQLRSSTATTDKGLAITDFRVETLALNSTSYNTIDGTSMATPEVAGLATMLRAYNAQYTSADTVNAIKRAGRSITALSGKTTSGNAIDVMASLAYINSPVGLTAAVQ